MEYYFREIHSEPFSILFAGHEKCKAGNTNLPHIRPYHLLVYIVGGKGIYHTDKGSYVLGKGCSFFAFPGARICYQADCEEPWEYYWIAFKGEIEQALAQSGITKQCPIHRAIAGEVEIQRCFVELIEMCRAEETFCRWKLFSLFYELLHYYSVERNVFNDTVEECGTALNPHVERALNLIAMHQGEPLSISVLAKSLGLSRGHFSALFTQQLQVTPAIFLREYRLKFSAYLLATTDEPIGDIADRSGFSDYSYYANQFHKLFGLSPTAYRKKFRI